MPDNHDPNPIRARAEHMLRGGTIGSAFVVASGRVEKPIAIQAPNGRLHSWYVPVTVGNQLAGFFQFLPNGTFMRFSSFQHRASELTGCPASADWLDPYRIQARAEVERQSDETSGKPFLTFDRTPDRLVWAVPLTKAGGNIRHVYVAGEIVFVPPS